MRFNLKTILIGVLVWVIVLLLSEPVFAGVKEFFSPKENPWIYLILAIPLLLLGFLWKS
jgi:hypothetical protein